MRIALQVGAGPDVQSIVPQVLAAERDGFQSAWVSGRYDPPMQALLAAPSTSTIELGTGIVTTWQRHPAALAQQALTIQSASKGRFTLGIGVGHRFMIEGQLGFEWRPVRHLKEYLTCLAPLMAGETVAIDGAYVKLKNFKLGTAGLAPPARVVVAALAPQMLRLAGRMADGTIIFLGGLRYVRDIAIPTIRHAAERAGRARPRVIAGVPVWVTDRDAKRVREDAAPKVANYDQRPVYRQVLDLDGSARAADVVIIGSEREVRERIAAYAEAGVDDFLGSVLADVPAESEATRAVLGAIAREADRSRPGTALSSPA